MPYLLPADGPNYSLPSRITESCAALTQEYSGLLCGVLRGALEMVQVYYSTTNLLLYYYTTTYYYESILHCNTTI